MNSVGVLFLQSRVIIPLHAAKLSCRNVERAVICVLYALVSFPLSEMKGAKIRFDRSLGAHRMSSRPPSERLQSGKNYWAILRRTGIPESIRAIGDSYSLFEGRGFARVGAASSSVRNAPIGLALDSGVWAAILPHAAPAHCSAIPWRVGASESSIQAHSGAACSAIRCGMALRRTHRRALKVLAKTAPCGVTEALMLAHGFTADMPARLSLIAH